MKSRMRALVLGDDRESARAGVELAVGRTRIRRRRRAIRRPRRRVCRPERRSAPASRRRRACDWSPASCRRVEHADRWRLVAAVQHQQILPVFRQRRRHRQRIERNLPARGLDAPATIQQEPAARQRPTCSRGGAGCDMTEMPRANEQCMNDSTGISFGRTFGRSGSAGRYRKPW